MDLGTVADLVRSYPWKCVECKTCEICQEKGDDVCVPFSARLLITDVFCERLVFSFVILATEGGTWTVLHRLCKIRLRESGIVHPAHIIHPVSVRRYLSHHRKRDPRQTNNLASRPLLRRLVQNSYDPPGGENAERSHRTCQTVILTCQSLPTYPEGVCASRHARRWFILRPSNAHNLRSHRRGRQNHLHGEWWLD